MTAGPLVEAQALTVAVPGQSRGFGRRIPRDIVRGVDLAVPRGGAVGLVGESGSGKTTLGRALVGLAPAAAGRVLFDGADLAAAKGPALRALRARMQMIFQDPQSALNPRLTIGTTLVRPLEAFGRLEGRRARRARAAELLDLVGLPGDALDRYPHELSGGQRQRIGIARAVALEPDFIVADEIVSGLDVSTQAQILLLLEDLRRRLGLTLVFISHDLSVVRVLCDEVVVLLRGEVVEAGPCAAVFDAPRHAYTAALLQAVPLPEIDPAWLDRPALAAHIPPLAASG
ncbi:peptide/nickel transport system ATP-binding protein [Inquilinus ginsengisoli]|uniref:Peptide/nickel transport system ATP-binding protein n=1 Tax=Inquilinus ginsengisoli TaxID=363840 RepID=A0ABU1JMA9_9PROT|nr:ATP-binding cassette domain-containing protein [Inquilinus ginsengisoli]MDR6289169.1 peptide/nickel transport system ATP-binding protein [Inquilinus ginsengisoli]